MAGKNIQVNLTFNADTSAAKAKMQELQQQLSNLASMPITGTGIGEKMQAQLRDATQKAVQLKLALHNATNVDTGKLNFGKFAQELKRNKTSLEQYAMALKKLGPEGTQAFTNIAHAIRQSETPIVQLQGRLRKLGDTFMNTIRWQISSSLISGVTRAFTGTIEYAKELNESLNNIRIVTGKSIDDMSKFATQANKAAKALSATTTEYTNASLIYYQQGLSDKQVLERAETTLKLANVVGEQAETVSEWMTAIWNNFDDGSKELEYYADVLAALGAATASSADEIAGGLEKFAAVADTVGLSYEYAASALATITAETRQSEDVVGTALKTIFARIESLKLGETLEDGTSLGQYSAALEKVGVSIKDANGNLKDMDDILNEIGATWGLLAKDEQVALAQSVAGIRQYNQFIGLMSNWDVMKENVELTKEANGQLEYMNSIYAQGIEGSSARVKATLEEIKNTLLDENDLVPLLNFAEGFLGIVNDLLQAFGGLPGILTTIGALMLNIYGPQVAAGMRSMLSGIQLAYGALSGSTQAARSNAIVQSTNLAANMSANQGYGEEGILRSQYLKEDAEITTRIEADSKEISAHNRAQLELLLQILQTKREITLETARERDAAVENAETAKRKLETHLDDDSIAAIEKTSTLDMRADAFANGRVVSREKTMAEATSLRNNVLESDVVSEEDKERVRKSYDKLDNASREAEESGKALKAEKAKGKDADPKKIEELSKAYRRNNDALKTAKKEYSSVVKSTKTYAKTLDATTKDSKEARKAAEDLGEAKQKEYKANEKLNKQKKDVKTSNQEILDAERKAAQAGQDYAQKMIKGMQTVASSAAGLMMITSAVDSLSDAIARGEAGFGNYLSTITSVLFGVSMLATAVLSLKFGTEQLTLAEIIGQKIKKKENKERKKNVLAIWLENMAKKAAAREAEKEAATVEKTEGKKRTAKLSTILTNIAEWISRGPTGWAIAAAIGVAIAGLLATAVAINVGSKKSAANKEEQAEAANTKFEETNEEVEANGELYDAYMEAYDTYTKTGEEKEKLAEQAQKLAEAYGVEGAALAALSGDYTKLTDSIIATRIAELKNQSDVANQAIGANAYKMDDTARSGKGHKSGSGYVANFNDGGASGDETEMVAAIRNYLATGEHKDAGILNFDDKAGAGDLQLNLANRSSEDYAKAYEALSDILTEASSNGASNDSELFNEVSEWVNRNKENYDLWKKQKDTVTAANAGVKVLETKSASGKSVHQISDFNDYMSYRNQLLPDDMDKDSDEYKAILTELGNQANTQEYETMARAIDEQAEKIGEDAEKWLKAEYENADAIQIKAMATVEVTPKMTKEEFLAAAQEKVIEAAKAYRDEIALEYEIATDAKDAAKEYAIGLQSVNDELSKNTDLLHRVTALNIKLNKEVEKAAKIWKDNAEGLFSSSLGTMEYAVALSNVSTALETLFGLDTEKYDLTSLVHENKELIQDFFNGNLKVFDDLQKEIANSVAQTYSSVQGLDGFIEQIFSKEYKAGDIVDLSQFPEIIAQIEAAGALGITAIQKVAEAAGFAITVVDGKITNVARTVDGSSLTSWAKEQKEDIEKSLKVFDEEIDRYHEIKEALNDIERELDIIASLKEKAFASDKDYFDDDLINKQKEALALQKELISKMELDFTKDQTSLNTWGFSTDEDGRISNYEDVFKSQLNQYNKMVKEGRKDEADKKWKEFENDIKQYESTLNGLEDERQALMEMRYDQEETRLEDINEKVERSIAFADDQLRDLEYTMSKIEDDAFAAADAIANLGGQALLAEQKHDAYVQGIYDTLMNPTGGGTSFTEDEVKALLGGDMSVLEGKQITEAQAEQMRAYAESLYETNQNIFDLQEQVREKVTDAYDAWNEKLARNTELIEHNQTILESYKNIIDLTGQDALGISDELMSEINLASVDSARAILKSNKEIYDANKKAYEDAKTAYDEAIANGVEPPITEEQLQAIEDGMLESEQTFMDSWTGALEAAGEAFDAEVERILKKFDDAMGGLEEKMDWFDKLQARNEIFYKDYEKTYEISKLNRQINESLDNTDSVKGSQALRDIQKQLLAYQEEGAEMSKYDLEYLQKSYDLELARIALEEAQNAKSTVRLTRDSEGNYGYTYTADEGAVDKAQQAYEDKLYAMEKFFDESSTSIQSQIMDWNSQMQQELGALDKSADDYDEKAKAIVDHYMGLINSLSNEGQEILIRGKEMNEEYGTHAAETFKETIMGKLYTDLESYQEFNDLTQEAISKTLEELENNILTYQQNTSGIYDDAGIDMSNYANHVQGEIDSIKGKNEELVTSTNTMATNMGTAFGNVLSAAQSFASTYQTKLKPIIDKNAEIAKSMTDILKAYEQLTGKDFTSWFENEIKKTDKTSTGNNTENVYQDSNKGDERKIKLDEKDGKIITYSGYNSNGNRVQWYQDSEGYQYEVSKLSTMSNYSGKIKQTYNKNDNLVTDEFREKYNGKKGQFTTSLPKDPEPEKTVLKAGMSFNTANVSGNQETLKNNGTGDGTWNVNYDQTQDSFDFTIKEIKDTETNGVVLKLGTAGKWYGTNKVQKFMQPGVMESQSIGGGDIWVRGKEFLKLLDDKNYILPSFDTGGYTGAWGPEGRIAMLHQKEIVLNAHDTENFLTAINIVRSMTDKLEANARAAQFGFSELRAAAGLPAQGQLEQNIHIEASFPNATDHNEIEEAFGNLVNLAAQYANRK